jgi:O-antigen ligase
MNTSKTRIATVLSGFALTLPVVSLLTPKAVVPLLLVTVALAGGLYWHAEREFPRLDRGFTAVFGLLVIWCAAASFWSFDVAGSLILTLRIAVIFAAGLLLFEVAGSLNDSERHGIGLWLLIGIGLSLTIMVIEVGFGFPIFELFKDPPKGEAYRFIWLSRGATAMAIVIWPATAYLWRRNLGWKALILPAFAALILSFLVSAAAKLAIVAGAVIFVAAALLHRTTARWILFLGVVLVLAGPVVAAKSLSAFPWRDASKEIELAAHRMEIWSFSLELIQERPFFGWGLDGSRQISRLKVRSVETGRPKLPLHPHNALLQILLELGAVGGFVALGFLWLVTRRLDALTDRHRRAAGQAVFISTLVIASLSFGLWQSQWLAFIACAAAFLPLTAGSSRAPMQIEENAPGHPRPND